MKSRKKLFVGTTSAWIYLNNIKLFRCTPTNVRSPSLCSAWSHCQNYPHSPWDHFVLYFIRNFYLQFFIKELLYHLCDALRLVGDGWWKKMYQKVEKWLSKIFDLTTANYIGFIKCVVVHSLPDTWQGFFDKVSLKSFSCRSALLRWDFLCSSE